MDVIQYAAGRVADNEKKEHLKDFLNEIFDEI
jgi:hypothetical protein